MRTSQRGSALLTSVIVILVLTVIGVGIINFAARELSGASAGMHDQALAACADAARQRLMSQFHALGFQPSSITALNVPLGTTSTSGAKAFAKGGHYDADDADPASIQITQVSYLPDNAFGPTNAVRDLTGIVPLVGQGGKPLKVVVRCAEGGVSGDPSTARQLEVEFGIRFGL